MNFREEIQMKQELRIAIIGDYNPDLPVHDATEEALQHAARAADVKVNSQWLATPSLEDKDLAHLHNYSALWIAPGSPYRSMIGVLQTIRVAREEGIPLFATCGGFQHVVIEYARNVMKFQDAQHAEYDPFASTLFITALTCSLLGKTMEVQINPASQTAAYYDKTVVQEKYYCNFGLNPLYRSALHEQGLRIVGVDQDDEARILELPSHPFFISTLFVPQLTSSWEKPHPLIMAYLQKAAMRTETAPSS
jgi:CTP synthase (UTP-ammonia lyase)